MTLRVDWRASCGAVGIMTKWLWVPLAFPLALAIYYGDSLVPFLVTIATTVLVGLGLERLGSERDVGLREGFLVVALTWAVFAAVGAIPFVLAGRGALSHPVNALFESMSGITTTGATIVVDYGIHSRSILMWRQTIQWLGGLSILVLAIAVLSRLSVGGAQLMETESQTADVRKLTPQIDATARLLWSLYLGLTIAVVVALYGLHLVGLAPEMTLYDAIAHAFTGLSTSGFSPRPESIGAFSPAVQWVITITMIVGATNFVLLYYLVNGDPRRLLDSEEFRFYLGILGVATLLVFVLLTLDPRFGVSEATIRHVVFQVVSIVTTTGYASVDFNAWPATTKHVLFLCMFLGGMAGSTTCSIKTLRWLVALKSFRRDLFTAIHPEAIQPIRLSGQVVDEETIRDVYVYVLLSIVLFVLATLVVILDSARAGLALTEFEALSATAATFFNIGPAFGIAGPFDNYAAFGLPTKLFMTFLMWMGRIEIVPVLVLFTEAYWRS